jgi:copper/silver efflux system protein
MSLSGIAIAIGVLVDAGIVMAENAIRHCELAEKTKGGRLNKAESLQVTLEAAQQVGRPIFFAMVIIILAFVPVFALTGQEGKLFHPLAFTKTFAMAGSTLLAITLVPALCATFIRGPFHAEDANPLMKILLAIYNPILDWALRFRKTVLGIALMLVVAALVLAFGVPRPLVDKLSTRSPQFAAKLPRGMGSEFMPTLNEGSLLFMPVLLPSTSLTEVKRVMAWQDRVIQQTPEVASVGGKLGRSETATDPAPIEMIETTIMLKPEAQWRPGMTKEKLVAELEEKLSQMPGYVPGFLQPIENRILMISTGIRAQVGIKILGDNLEALQQKANRISTLKWTAWRWRDTACARRMSWTWSKAASAATMFPRRFPGVSGFPFNSGCNAANAATSSGSAICSCRHRAARWFHSAQWRKSTAKSGQAKSPVKTAGCACSCRPTCKAAISPGS